jgi:hypothetical protein
MEIPLTGKELVKEIRRRHLRLKQDRASWENDWKRIAKIVNPRREFFDKWDWKKGSRIGTEVYDGTPGGALMLFASGMQGYTASPAIDWFRIVSKDRRLMQVPGVQEWYEQCTEEMYYQLAVSNFYNRLSAYFVDVGSIGTATMYAEWDYFEDKLCYTTYHPMEIYIEENKYGKVDTIHREYRITAKVAYEEFGDKLPQHILDAAKTNPYGGFDFIHAIYPNEDIVVGDPTNRGMRFRSVHILESGDEVVLRDRGYKTMPSFVWRWFKNDNEQYGRSPAHMAFVDIEKLNEENMTSTHARHLAVNPPMMAPESISDKISLRPGDVNYYTKTYEEEKIFPIHQGADLSAMYEEIKDVRDIINKHFYVDFFLMISQADATMTATEILERQSEKAVMLGPFVSIMNNEAFDAILDRTWQLLWDTQKLPPPPAYIWGYADPSSHLSFDVEYVGPIAQAQKVLFKSPRKALDIMIPYMNAFPQMSDYVNPDKLFSKLADAHNFPKDAINSEAEVASIRKARQEAQQQQEQLAAAQATARAAKDASKAQLQGGGSVLDKYLGSQQ